MQIFITYIKVSTKGMKYELRPESEDSIIMTHLSESNFMQYQFTCNSSRMPSVNLLHT